MRKPYNYRNPTPEQLRRQEVVEDILGGIGVILCILSLVGACLVLR